MFIEWAETNFLCFVIKFHAFFFFSKEQLLRSPKQPNNKVSLCFFWVERVVSQLRGSFSNLWTNFQCMKMALYLTGPQNYGFPTMAISNWYVITTLNQMSSTLSNFYLIRMLHLWWYILSLPICINMAFSGLIMKLYLSRHCLNIMACVFSYM